MRSFCPKMTTQSILWPVRFRKSNRRCRQSVQNFKQMLFAVFTENYDTVTLFDPPDAVVALCDLFHHCGISHLAMDLNGRPSQGNRKIQQWDHRWFDYPFGLGRVGSTPKSTHNGDLSSHPNKPLSRSKTLGWLSTICHSYPLSIKRFRSLLTANSALLKNH